MDNLKPCPFCGGEAKVIENNSYTDIHSVICKNCFTESDRYQTQEKAIEAWNTRKPIEKILDELSEREHRFMEKWKNNPCSTVFGSRTRAYFDAQRIVMENSK